MMAVLPATFVAGFTVTVRAPGAVAAMAQVVCTTWFVHR